MTLSELYAISPADFTATLAPVFENAPWVAVAVEGGRPFASLGAWLMYSIEGVEKNYALRSRHRHRFY